MKKHLLYFVCIFLSLQVFAQTPSDLTLTEASGMMYRDTIIPAGSKVYVLVSPFCMSYTFAYQADFYYSVDGILQAHRLANIQAKPWNYYFYTSDYDFVGFQQKWQAPSTPGVHIMKIWTANPDGMPDTDPSNDTLTIRLIVKSTNEVAQRTALLENFTSSSCGPCDTYDKFLQRNWSVVSPNQFGSTMAIINYHTNIPASEPSYNGDAAIKMNHYGVGGNPVAFMDNENICTPIAVQPYPDSSTLRKFADMAAYIKMDAVYSIINDSISVTVKFTPLKTFADSGYKLNVAIVEDACNYHTFLQEFVFRKMLPNANGMPISLQPNVQQTFTFGYRFNTGNVTAGSFNLWGGMNNIKAVAFINKNDFETPTLQAAIAHPAGWATLNEPELRSFALYPNPANDYVALLSPEINTAGIEVFALSGQRVNCAVTSTGEDVKKISTVELTPGVYIVKLVFEDNSSAFRRFVKEN